MSAVEFMPGDRVFHLERGAGTVRSFDEYIPWIGQMLDVRFDELGTDGGREALVPESDLIRHEGAVSA